MARIIAVANQKGGVGKTTTCVNLSAALHKMGRRVMLVDGDPQGNASSGMGVSKTNRPNTYDMLINSSPAEDCIVHTDYGDVIPTGNELAAASVELIDAEEREYVLKKALIGLYTDYDYIFIDCPPSLGVLTINALTACNSILVPIQCEFYALEGVTKLMESIKMMKSTLNPELEIFGIVLTMYDKRTSLSKQVADEVRNYFEKKVFKTVIQRNVRLSEAPSYGESIFEYDKLSKGAQAYRDLAKEVIRRG